MENKMRYDVNIINFDDERDITTVAMFAENWVAAKFIAAMAERYFDDGFDVVIEELK